MKNLIIIPSRLESSRLPNKPLADINGEPMIVHVFNRAREANIANVIVAAGNIEIKEVIENVGGEAILTKSDLVTIQVDDIRQSSLFSEVGE